MKITFLGTGTSQGIPVIACRCNVCKSTDKRDKRLRSSVLIEVNEKTLLIDAGPDFRQQMLRANVCSLSAILLTHNHKDHIAGLDDVRAFNWAEKKAIDIYAENRVLKTIRSDFAYAFTEIKYSGVPEIDLHSINTEPFQIQGIDIIPIRVMHGKLPIFGFRIGNFAYITDASAIPDETYRLLQNLDVLVINGLRWEKHLTHFTLPEALSEIEKIKPKQAYITHIGHQLGKHEDVSSKLPSHVTLSFDELEFKIDA